ncbi:MAG: 2-oxoacid:acceptor oxidoreductase family protein [Thermoplasmata archaeon]
MRTELRFAGFGGQGVIMMGHIMGKAAVIDGKNVTLTQSYGPEARGGACSVDVIVSDGEIYYPHVREPDVLVIMSQSALKSYASNVKKDGILLVDNGLVECSKIDMEVKGLPATEFAKDELNTRIVSNIVMLGFLVGVTELVDVSSMKEAIRSLVPGGTEDKNIDAFEIGYQEGKK